MQLLCRETVTLTICSLVNKRETRLTAPAAREHTNQVSRSRGDRKYSPLHGVGPGEASWPLAAADPLCMHSWVRTAHSHIPTHAWDAQICYTRRAIPNVLSEVIGRGKQGTENGMGKSDTGCNKSRQNEIYLTSLFLCVCVILRFPIRYVVTSRVFEICGSIVNIHIPSRGGCICCNSCSERSGLALNSLPCINSQGNIHSCQESKTASESNCLLSLFENTPVTLNFQSHQVTGLFYLPFFRFSFLTVLCLL